MNKRYIKMIITDLDGTLLNNRGRLEHETVNIIKEFQNRGGIVALATSRHWFECKDIVSKLLDENGFVITGNGQIIYNSKFEVIKTFKYMKKTNIISYKSIIGNPITLVTDSGDYLINFSNKLHQLLVNIYVNSKNHYGYKRKLSNFDKISDEINIEKIIIHSPLSKEIIDRLKNNFNVVYNRNNRVELQSKLVDKSYAAQFLIEKLGFNNDEIIVFGDDDNDIKMLKWFKNSYAMDNGCDNAIESANAVTLSNCNNGVAMVVKKVLEDM